MENELLIKKIKNLKGKEKERLVEKIILINENMIHTIAHKFENFIKGNGIEYKDLVHEGMLGLLEAIKKFDENKGTKFSTYAWWRINKCISRLINRNKIKRLSLEEEMERFENGKGSRYILHSYCYNQFFDKYYYEENEIKDIMKKLKISNREIEIISLYLAGHTLSEIGKIYGITKQRVHSIKNVLCKKLRNLYLSNKTEFEKLKNYILDNFMSSYIFLKH